MKWWGLGFIIGKGISNNPKIREMGHDQTPFRFRRAISQFVVTTTPNPTHPPPTKKKTHI